MANKATLDFLIGLKSWRSRSFYTICILASKLRLSEKLIISLRSQVYGRFQGKVGTFDLRPGTIDAWTVHGNHEVETHARVRQIPVDPGSIMFDVGGYIGSFSLRYRGLFEQIYIFEPFPENAKALEQNISLNQAQKSITLVKSGVAEKEGNRSLYLLNHDTHSLVPREHAKHINICTVTLDKYVERTRIEQSKVNFIKIDVEGGELDVLKGAFNLLRIAQPVIMAESNTITEKIKIENYLAKLGYVPIGSTDGRNFWYAVTSHKSKKYLQASSLLQ